jgi:hypothetical protein
LPQYATLTVNIPAQVCPKQTDPLLRRAPRRPERGWTY